MSGLDACIQPAASRAQRVGAAALMLFGVLAVYCPPALLDGRHTLAAGDFWELHAHRIRFAQENLFGPEHRLPAWYPRELMGTPFWSNIQSFPFLPTRWPLLLMDPVIGFVVGVILAALLAAGFTYLYCRRLGLGPWPAAVAGWTFACAGYFAARVNVGHLPLLEIYPALPLLLWLSERCLQLAGRPGAFARALLALGLAGGCCALAGHPQLFVYATLITVLYILHRAPNRVGLLVLAAFGVGIGLSAFVQYPMWLLIGRSTRLLGLNPPDNNVVFPYQRLLTFLFPWKDGWPESVCRYPARPLGALPACVFWDTVCYMGWMPILATAALAGRAIARRRWPERPWLFWFVIGVGALVVALPFAQQLAQRIPGTILRSPARQVYLTGFALALAMGAAMEWMIKSWLVREDGGRVHPPYKSKSTVRMTVAPGTAKWLRLAVIAIVAIHVYDLAAHGRAFLLVLDAPSSRAMEMAKVERIRGEVGSGRVAMDVRLGIAANRQIDDAGFFDSIMLAPAYRALMELGGMPAGYNNQVFSASGLPGRALAFLGVKRVYTTAERKDLIDLGVEDGAHVYGVADALPRAGFISMGQTRFFFDEKEIYWRLRDVTVDLRRGLMLPVEAGLAGGAAEDAKGSVVYRRPGSDRIELDVQADGPGFVRVIEAFDPGWSGAVDGRPAVIFRADGFSMALEMTPGSHKVVMVYRTPGARIGLILSGLSLGLLGCLVVASTLLNLNRRVPRSF